MKSLWILTEERPKNEVILTILSEFSKDFQAPIIFAGMTLLPILDKDKFSFKYKVIGFNSEKVKDIYILKPLAEKGAL